LKSAGEPGFVRGGELPFDSAPFDSAQGKQDKRGGKQAARQGGLGSKAAEGPRVVLRTLTGRGRPPELVGTGCVEACGDARPWRWDSTSERGGANEMPAMR
jgi:hypothetical protein